MHADPKGVLTGVHFLDGDHACCEGTLAAGARFAAGYPITPSTEVVERFAARIPTVGGVFIQMEDELAASIAIQGAVWGGAKAFTVTSGPGFSLMMEHIGYAAMTETPCVFVNVQRGGPSTGLPTLPAQADMMQARWGSHGDYEHHRAVPQFAAGVLRPDDHAASTSPRSSACPVMMMLDECVGHMTEKVVIPERERDRDHAAPLHPQSRPQSSGCSSPGDDLVPEMVKAGDGYRFHVTGLTHDERGYPSMNVETQDKLVRRLQDKLKPLQRTGAPCSRPWIWRTPKWWWCPTASRRAWRSGPSQMARAQGIKAGKFRLISAWPFPDAAYSASWPDA